jgi:hypothetical protein
MKTCITRRDSVVRPESTPIVDRLELEILSLASILFTLFIAFINDRKIVYNTFKSDNVQKQSNVWSAPVLLQGHR